MSGPTPRRVSALQTESPRHGASSSLLVGQQAHGHSRAVAAWFRRSGSVGPLGEIDHGVRVQLGHSEFGGSVRSCKIFEFQIRKVIWSDLPVRILSEYAYA